MPAPGERLRGSSASRCRWFAARCTPGPRRSCTDWPLPRRRC